MYFPCWKCESWQPNNWRSLTHSRVFGSQDLFFPFLLHKLSNPVCSIRGGDHENVENQDIPSWANIYICSYLFIFKSTLQGTYSLFQTVVNRIYLSTGCLI